MKRLSVHAVFAAATVIATGVVAVQALRLQQLRQLNAAVAAASQAPVATAPAAASDAGPAPGEDLRDAPRAVRLARATALSKAGAFNAAFKLYSGLIDPGALDAIGQQALFNLGNMYLRQGLGSGSAGAATTADTARQAADAGPLIELAKQRYRDLLRAAPHDWDARYNLERALRIAPEEHESIAEEPTGPTERRNVQMRGMEPGDLP